MAARASNSASSSVVARSSRERRQRLGVGHVGHVELVLEARLVAVERRLHVEDRAAVLDRDDAARREALPVADAVDLVEDRDLRVTGAKEVRVQRVHPAVLDGATRGDERLGGDLAAEDPLALLVGLGAAEDVDLDLLEVEEADELVEVVGHRRHYQRWPPRCAK